MAVEEAPDRAGRERGAVLAAQQLGQLDQRDVHLGLDRRQDHVTVSLNAMRAQVAALWQGRRTPFRPPSADPPDGARNRNAKAIRRRVAGQATINGANHPKAQVLGQGSRHARWPPLQHAW